MTLRRVRLVLTFSGSSAEGGGSFDGSSVSGGSSGPDPEETAASLLSFFSSSLVPVCTSVELAVAVESCLLVVRLGAFGPEFRRERAGADAARRGLLGRTSRKEGVERWFLEINRRGRRLHDLLIHYNSSLITF